MNGTVLVQKNNIEIRFFMTGVIKSTKKKTVLCSLDYYTDAIYS